jgi:hypothetical protein
MDTTRTGHGHDTNTDAETDIESNMDKDMSTDMGLLNLNKVI